MSDVVRFRAAHLLTPLVLSGFLAASIVAAVGWAVGQIEADAGASLLSRLWGNGFVILIAMVGLWALVYGLVQLWALQSTADGVMARLAGHGGVTPGVVAAPDPTMAAGLFSERWDYLATRRIAPLSYAIWVLPLLGFIGTVIGISNAIGELGQVFAQSARDEALSSVLGALQFAFDTTFAGLVLVIPVMALTTTVSLKSDAVRDLALADTFGSGGAD